MLVSCADRVPLTRPLPAPVAIAVPAPVAGRPAPRATGAPVPIVLPASPESNPASIVGGVDARFPAPPTVFATPAFEPGRSAFTSNAELQALIAGLAREPAAAGVTVRRLALGASQAAAPIEALLFTRHRETVADGILLGGRPSVLLVAQQHGDEPAGAEALIVVARELAQGTLAALLDRINVIVLPRANPDGAAAARRLTASGVDLNRDHLLLRSPEAQAQARLLRDYRPLVLLDLHEYTLGTAFAGVSHAGLA